MLSKIPFKPEGSSDSDSDSDKEILRVGIIAELDAINLYEQLAAAAKSELLKRVLLDIAREEKVHVGEFQELLLRMDKEQKDSLDEGMKEVSEMGD